jgi:gas vesicle protein
VSTQHQETLKTIKEMKNGQEPEAIPSREHDSNSSVVGAGGGEFVDRIKKRRNNINSLPGLIREHARLILQTRNREIPLEMAEVLSRQYSRHKEMVSALEQRTLLAAIQEQLQALRGNPSQQLLIDEDSAKELKQ